MPDMQLAAGAALACGVVSAALYARKRHWRDAALALAAGTALALLLAGAGQRADSAATVTIASEDGVPHLPSDALQTALLAVPGAQDIALRGHGLHEAQWRDLPAKPLQWSEPETDLLWLDYPRAITFGRSFMLTARRSQPQAGWRLQLLAENGQVLTEAVAPGAAPSLSVQWRPPLAERLVLRARLLDKQGAVLSQGPIPLRVEEAQPLQIKARFSAASFDARALNQLLADSNAIIDWQTVLGKSLARSETARAALDTPNIVVADAALLENAAARSELLAQTSQGVPLLILGGNAADAAMWQRELGLPLRPQSATTEQEDTRHFAMQGAVLDLPPAGLMPVPGAWQVLASDKDGKPWLWQRNWQKGRIVWVGTAGWHRYAISAPVALGQWWQELLDRAARGGAAGLRWQIPDVMPLPGLRTELCAQGAKSGTLVHVETMPVQPSQLRSDKTDAACMALWPRQAGWLDVRSGGTASQVYIFNSADWPAWQKALRHDATVRYAARSRPAVQERPLAPQGGWPQWPAGLVFAACLLALWWRERR